MAIAVAGATPIPAAFADPEPELPAYKDTSLPFSLRAADLVSRMTLEEKYDQFGAMQPHATGWGYKPKAITRLGVRPYGYWGEANHDIYFPTLGSSGLNGAGTYQTQWPQSMGMATTWNTEAVQQMSHGISDEARVAYNNSCPPGEANPTPTGGACHGLSYWSPNQNLNRDPRWGRADESFTEDPYLAGKVASAYVVGLQGGTASEPNTIPTSDKDYVKAIATPKHYWGNNSEANRNAGTSNMTERSMHEYFLPPFAASAGGANARSLMTAYNAVSVKEVYTGDYAQASEYPTTWSPRDSVTPGGTPGTPTPASRYAIETLLRRTYGFDGYITSDCDGLTRVHQATSSSGHWWQPSQLGRQINKAEANAWTLKAGNDLDCSGADYPSTTGLVVSQNQGLVTEANVDTSLVRAFTARFQTGEFDDYTKVPWSKDESYTLAAGGDPAVKIGGPAHLATSHEASLEAPVLLKNDGVLPWSNPGSDKTIQLGHVDTTTQFQAGSYSGSRFAPGDSYTFAEGLAKLIVPSETLPTRGLNTPYLKDRLAIFPNAINANGNTLTVSKCSSDPCDPAVDVDTMEYRISQADNVLVTAGHRNNDGGEGSDRANVLLPRLQAELIRDEIAPLAAKYNKKIVVWMQGKAMFDITAFKDLPQVGAIVWSSFNGQYQGLAMAQLLFNETVTLEDGRSAIANFSGKLTQTWYSDVDAQLGSGVATGSPTVTAMMDYRMTKAEGATCGKTYMYYQVGAGCEAPHYVFGHGLSYSPFTYSTPTLSTATITPNDEAVVSVEVANMRADRPGKATVELYAKAPADANGDDRPLKKLYGFAKTGVLSGTPETVQLTLKGDDLWFWDNANHRREYPTGAWTIMTGPSSADADLKSVTLNVSGTRKPGVGVVSMLPDGHELNLMTPNNRIHSSLSVTKHDTTFWNLNDPALSVTYTSSDPAVATVDAKGTVTPVSKGAVMISVNVTADGESGSTAYPVVVTNGAPDTTGTIFANAYTSFVDFPDRTVSLEAAVGTGVQLAAQIAPDNSSATYTYQIAPMDTNTAAATVSPTGLFQATKTGYARVTVTADVGVPAKISQSALIYVRVAASIAEIQEKLDSTNNLWQGDYTADSWRVLAEARQTVSDVLNSGRTLFQEEVDELIAMFEGAVNGLKLRGDTSVLSALVGAYAQLLPNAGSYTSASWDALTIAVDAALALIADAANTSASDVTTSVTAMRSALSGLVLVPVTPTVSKTALNAVIAVAEAALGQASSYTTASVTALQTAVTAAKAVQSSSSATQAQVDTQVTNVTAATSGLVVASVPAPVHKGGLSSLTLVAQGVAGNTGTYTAASLAALQAAITAAQAVVADTGATQTSVSTAESTLASALAGLVVAAQNVQLLAVIGVAENLVASSYEAASWTALQTALTNARAALANSAASQSDYDAAAAAVSTAIKQLVPKAVADVSGIRAAAQALVDSLSALDASRYAPGELFVIANAIAAAKAVLANPNATQADLLPVLNSLTSASGSVANLKPISQVNVESPLALKVKAAQSKVLLIKGKSIAIPAYAYQGSGKVKVTWASSNNKIAAVSSSGTIKANKPGKATITVKAGAQQAKIAVTVVAKRGKDKVATVSAKVPASMKVGDVAYVTGSYQSDKAAGVKVTYASSKASVAAIDKAGQLVARGIGTATITVKAADKTKKYTVKVS